MTYSERALWKALRKIGPHMRRQAPIGRYIADFLSHEAKLVIEVDGGWHDLPEAQLHDAKRDAWLRSQGYRVLRFRDQQVVNDPAGVMAAILATLPPRWGKGRDGGEHAAFAGKVLEAAPPHELIHKSCAFTPTLPSPIEGEGCLVLHPVCLDEEGS